MIQRYLIPSLLSASALALSACGGDDPAPRQQTENQNPVAAISGAASLYVKVGSSRELSGEDSSDADGSIEGYSWSSSLLNGDSSEESIILNFTEQGNYSVKLTVTDNDGATDTEIVTFVAVNNELLAPIAKISPSATQSLVEGESITFSASDSSDEDGEIVSYLWSDGNTNSSTKITFEQLGEQTVSVTVTDDDGLTHSAQVIVNVKEDNGNQPPLAKLNPSDDLTVYQGDEQEFSTAGSSDSDGTITSYRWSNNDATTATANYSFDTLGEQTVSVTVTDDDGATDTTSVNVTVVEPPCDDCNIPVKAVITAPELTTKAGGSLNFSAANSTGKELSYLWSNGSTEASTSISFPEEGDFIVSLTVTNSEGLSNLATTEVKVEATAPTKTVIYFKNTQGFTPPHIYYWLTTPAVAAAGSFPGKAMTEVDTNWYSYEFDTMLSAASIIFAQEANVQTDTLIFDAATPCYQNGWVSLDECEYKADGKDHTAPEVSTTPKADTYTTAQKITLSVSDNEDPAPKLYYTIDGSAASKNSTEYAGEELDLSAANDKANPLVINTYAVDAEGNNDTQSFKFIVGEKPVEPELGANEFHVNCDGPYDEYSNKLRIYQVMVESFIDGDSNIGYGTGYGTSHHNGDLQGIINSLDYIKGLGMNALWMTPVFDSEGGGRMDATGYFTRNYFKIDPKWGDMEKMRELVDTAHAKGLYVIFDGVFGHHKGDIPSSPNGNTPQGGANPVSYPGSLPFYQEVAAYWIKELKIDGWRLDQAYQVPVDAWKDIRQTVVEASNSVSYSNSEGQTVHPLGYMVGEIWKGEQSIKDTGYGSESNRGLCSNFDFPGRYNLLQTFAGEEWASDSGNKDLPASHLSGVFDKQGIFPSNVRPNLMATNHDLVRIGDLLQRAGIAEPNDAEYWQRHKALFGFMGAYTGPITLYYGDEIGQEVPNFAQMQKSGCADAGLCDDHVSRDSGRVEGLNGYSASSNEKALRDYISKLMTIRDQEPALYAGERTHLEVGNAASIYADLKQKGGDTILYITNKSNSAATVSVSTTQMQASGTLSDLIDGTSVAEASGNYSISLAPWQTRYLKAN